MLSRNARRASHPSSISAAPLCVTPLQLLYAHYLLDYCRQCQDRPLPTPFKRAAVLFTDPLMLAVWTGLAAAVPYRYPMAKCHCSKRMSIRLCGWHILVPVGVGSCSSWFIALQRALSSQIRTKGSVTVMYSEWSLTSRAEHTEYGNVSGCSDIILLLTHLRFN